MKNLAHSVKRKKLACIPWLFPALIAFLLSAAVALSVIPRSLAAQTTMEVYQQAGKKAFGQQTSLDLFNDPKLGGKKLVHPFTEGDYSFAVFNHSNSAPLPYSLDILAENPANIPLVVSLQKNGEYIYGGAAKADMRPLAAVNLPETLLGGEKTDLYTISWAWDTENDGLDTAIGSDGTQAYTLTVTATGSIGETAVPPVTGDRARALVWIAITLTSVLLLILLFVTRRKNEDEDNQADPENI